MHEVHYMKYHQPGWSWEINKGKWIKTYMVWGPQTQEDVDRQGGINPPRDHWAANYGKGYVNEDDEYEDTVDGGHWKGASFDEVIANFPDDIAAHFRKAVEGVRCGYCQGSGEIWSASHDYYDCPDCGGKGWQ